MTLACEDGNSKLDVINLINLIYDEVVSVIDDSDDEKRVGNSLLQIW